MSARRITLGSNLLIYFYDPRDPTKQALAQQIVTTAMARDCVIGLQAVGEFYAVSTRKGMLSRTSAGREVLNILRQFPTFHATLRAHQAAAREAAAGRFSYWDCVLLASAEEAGCEILLSEDMADGARLGGITVRNPFGPKGLSAAASDALAP